MYIHVIQGVELLALKPSCESIENMKTTHRCYTVENDPEANIIWC